MALKTFGAKPEMDCWLVSGISDIGTEYTHRITGQRVTAPFSKEQPIEWGKMRERLNGLTQRQRTALWAIRRGNLDVNGIMAATDMDRNPVYSALLGLKRKGLIRMIQKGVRHRVKVRLTRDGELMAAETEL